MPEPAIRPYRFFAALLFVAAFLVGSCAPPALKQSLCDVFRTATARYRSHGGGAATKLACRPPVQRFRSVVEGSSLIVRNMGYVALPPCPSVTDTVNGSFPVSPSGTAHRIAPVSGSIVIPGGPFTNA